jgi:glycosyltransferase involved in cell wall biosynthesis
VDLWTKKSNKQEQQTSDNLRREYLGLISKGDLQEQIILPGKAGNVGDWYRIADIFVLSSRFEGFPNVLLEAMASGTACVSFDCDTGPRDLIEDGYNGLLVEELNTDELAKSIERLITDAALRNTLAKNATIVREEYNESIILEKWSKLLEFVITDHRN